MSETKEKGYCPLCRKPLDKVKRENGFFVYCGACNAGFEIENGKEWYFAFLPERCICCRKDLGTHTLVRVPTIRHLKKLSVAYTVCPMCQAPAQEIGKIGGT